MTIPVHIPTILQKAVSGQPTWYANGHTVGECLNALCKDNPAVYDRIYSKGDIRRYISVYINEDNILNLDGAETTLSPEDEIFIVPAMAGG